MFILRGLCAAGFGVATGSLVDAEDDVREIGGSSQAAVGISGCEEPFTAVSGSGALGVSLSVASREESARGATLSCGKGGMTLLTGAEAERSLDSRWTLLTGESS